MNIWPSHEGVASPRCCVERGRAIAEKGPCVIVGAPPPRDGLAERAPTRRSAHTMPSRGWAMVMASTRRQEDGGDAANGPSYLIEGRFADEQGAGGGREGLRRQVMGGGIGNGPAGVMAPGGRGCKFGRPSMLPVGDVFVLYLLF